MWTIKILRFLGDNMSEYFCNFDIGKNFLNKLWIKMKRFINLIILKLRILLLKEFYLLKDII